MRLRGIVAEDFCNYKLPSMFLICTSCDWKCCTDIGMSCSLCQNAPLVSGKDVNSSPIVDVANETIYKMYASNPITSAVVIGGLEPILQLDELDDLITEFRERGEYCDFVIYTGYYPEEIGNEIASLSRHKNIIVKFGRYIPDHPMRFDDVLGVNLASPNQFARRIS